MLWMVSSSSVLAACCRCDPWWSRLRSPSRQNIPVYAGIMLADSSGSGGRSECPRVHGENCALRARFSPFLGIPPRARGQLWPRFHRPHQLRNTPACTGTTLAKHGQLAILQEYPRFHGDNRGGRKPRRDGSGIPPLGRGQLFRIVGRFLRGRNTPACTGTTCPAADPSRRSTEYPRLHGDNMLHLRGGPDPEGIPPRARG